MRQVLPTPTTPPGTFDAGIDFGLARSVMDAQRMQWDLMLSWQRALTDLQQDLWDQWISHWGGGVPLDG